MLNETFFPKRQMSQSSTVRPHWVHTTHPSPSDAEAECFSAEQEKWEVADDLDAEQEDRAQGPINDSPKD